MDEKETLHWYLRVQRDALASKLDGVSEYDARCPHVPTGTNLLGLVKRRHAFYEGEPVGAQPCQHLLHRSGLLDLGPVASVR